MRHAALERHAVVVVGAALLCPLLIVLGYALSLPFAVGIGGAVAVAVLAVRILPRRLDTSLDGVTRSHPFWAGLWALVTLVAISQNARLTVFMIEPSRASASVTADDFYVHHNCFSAYYIAAGVSATDATHLYAKTHYDTPPEGTAPPLGIFAPDYFYYPPPFLLLVKPAVAITSDFLRARAAWFVAEATVLAVALLVAARWLGKERAVAFAVATPLLWGSLPTMLTLQFGNFQLLAFAVAVLAMIAFEARRPAVGGALLALVMVGKIFPGILLVNLVARRQWRSAAWTIAFAAFYVITALVVLGSDPFRAFASEAPSVANGQAFTMLEWPAVAMINHGISGIPLKLGYLLGAGGAMRTTGVVVSWAYSAALVVVVFFSSRRGQTDDRCKLVVLSIALVQLASLRSPFAPDVYAVFAPLWLTILLATWEVIHRRRTSVLALLAVAFASFQMLAPLSRMMDGWSVPKMLAYTTPMQVIALLVVVAALRFAIGREDAPANSIA